MMYGVISNQSDSTIFSYMPKVTNLNWEKTGRLHGQTSYKSEPLVTCELLVNKNKYLHFAKHLCINNVQTMFVFDR